MALKTIASRLITDECGATISIELIFLATIVVIGLLTGLTSYRDAVVQELGDSAAGIASLQQTFSIDEISLTGRYGAIPYDSFVSASSFTDQTDQCEDVLDASSRAPMCIEISAATIENE